MPPPGLRIYPRPRVTLADSEALTSLVATKVDHFMFLPREPEPLVSISIKMSSLAFNCVQKFGNSVTEERTVNVRTDGQTDGHNASAC